MVWGEVNAIKYLFYFWQARGDLESSRAGFMRSPAVLASWGSPAGRTSGMAIVHCNLLILITYYMMYLLIARAGFREKSSKAGFEGWLVNHLDSFK